MTMLFDADIRPNALVKAHVGGREIVGEVVSVDGDTVEVNEFGASGTQTVVRQAVEVKQ